MNITVVTFKTLLLAHLGYKNVHHISGDSGVKSKEMAIKWSTFTLLHFRCYCRFSGY
jgi:hypothetical protein